ncbi:SpaH/EbpB family LPXTG-anchored major pilin [uncultured Catenibacterium sp.]|uniref:SpaH/EbpB family LPXTG-anchored major pilin n=1 Tax=uncultured Catenibacterium sp. TaxID=286142 RepID=UPI0025D689E3|nr:SpaH/EbpB family LPXTG-anchored major pilin [uncultured Catenibacterium sp.]
MKSIKRIIALLLTAVMTMTMSVTAFAANTNCSLTVNVKDGQDLKGQTINLYKLFDVTVSSDKKNYSYTVSKEAGYKAALVEVLGSSITADSKDEEIAKAVRDLGQNDSKEVQNFANEFTAKALTKGLTATKTSGKIIGENKTSYDFTELAAGYYLVYVTGGNKIQSSLVTVTGADGKVSLKTEAPSITKAADKETVSIGQVVKYTVTGSVPDTTGYSEYVYKIHDTLSKGLDFVKNANGDALDSANAVNVTVAFGEGVTDKGTAPTTATLDTTKNTMSLDLSAWVRTNQENKGKEFTVTYYAKVNKNAVVTEKNKAELEYGNNPGDTTKTKPSEVKTPTYYLDINKIKAGTTDDRLAGAKFKLYKNSTDSEENVIKVTGSEGNYVVDPTSENTVFESVKSISGEGYNLRVNGLAEGIYYLVETEAPAGYNKLTDPIKVEIKKSTTEDVNAWTLSKNGEKEEDKIIDVENSTGSMLPSTGGMGTIAFAVVAAILVFGVAVSFIRDRKREN